MELEGRKELVDTGKSSRTCSVPTVSLRLAVLNVFQGFFGPKMAVFGPKLRVLKPRSTTGESHSRPPALSDSHKPRTGHIFGYMAQNAIPRTPTPPANPHFLWFPPLRIAQTDA